ncbi:MAG: hypothetical protein WA938_02490 [Candidatus Dormiibacterota bacterium]
MAFVDPFYSVNEEAKPEDTRRWHDQSDCGPAKEIAKRDRRPGTGGYSRCEDCKSLDP